MKYLVQVSYTNPSHEHVSLRRRVDTVNRIVEATDEQQAILRVSRQQQALGFMVKEAKIVEQKKNLTEEVEQIEESVATAQKVMDRANVVAKTNPDPKKRFAAGGLANKAMLRTINPTGVNTGITRGGGNKTYRKITGKVPPYQLTKKTGVSEEVVTEASKEGKDVMRSVRSSLKSMDLRQGVDSDKRVSGYKMSPAVKAAQAKSDALSKPVKRPQAGTLAAVHKSMEKEMQRSMKKEETKKYTDMSPEEKWKDARAEKDPVKKNAKLGALAMGGGGNITPKKPSLIPNSPRRSAADPKKYTQKADGQWVREEVEVVEAVKDVADIGEYDYEGDMAKSQLRSILANAKRMHDMLEDNTNLPEWVQSKITLAQDYVQTAASYMESEMNEEVSIDEKMNLATAKMGDVIKDFQKSDAPQFKGKSKEKKREMAIAAKLEAERGEMKEEAEPVEEKYMGFKKLAASIKAKGGARDPEAVAAAIGRKKYGKEKFQAAAAAGKKMSEAALDPVGKEDKDIDNDGDSDKTDVYLSKRRKAIGSAIRKKVADKMGK